MTRPHREGGGWEEPAGRSDHWEPRETRRPRTEPLSLTSTRHCVCPRASPLPHHVPPDSPTSGAFDSGNQHEFSPHSAPRPCFPRAHWNSAGTSLNLVSLACRSNDRRRQCDLCVHPIVWSRDKPMVQSVSQAVTGSYVPATIRVVLAPDSEQYSDHL